MERCDEEAREYNFIALLRELQFRLQVYHPTNGLSCFLLTSSIWQWGEFLLLRPLFMNVLGCNVMYLTEERQ